ARRAARRPDSRRRRPHRRAPRPPAGRRASQPHHRRRSARRRRHTEARVMSLAWSANELNPAPDPSPFDDQLSVVVTPGLIEYTDRQGNKQKFYFQCNPTTLTRSRTITRSDTAAADQAAGTTDKRGQAGRKFTLRPTTWRIDSLELL